MNVDCNCNYCPLHDRAARWSMLYGASRTLSALATRKSVCDCAREVYVPKPRGKR